MAEALPLSDAELKLFRALVRNKVRFIIVGLSAAALQGAPVVTEDVDLWVEDLQSEEFRRALRSVDVAYCPPFGMNPPMLAGEGCEQVDLVLSLERIIVSKTAANREKDRRVLGVLKGTQATIQEKKSS